MQIDGKIQKSFEKAGIKDINALLLKVAKNRAEEAAFIKQFDESWGSAYLLSECFYIIISEAAAHYAEYVSGLETESAGINTYNALQKLQARATQQYLEIMTLVKNGFSDGAFARWRSMYELSIISSFILKFGDTVAEEFIKASQSEDRYDWAMTSGVFPETKRHVTFGDILKHCDMDTEAWRDDYTVANQTVHASPQGTFGRLGEHGGDKNETTRTDYGIAAPAIHSANTLALISSMLFSLFPEEKTMDKMSSAAELLDDLIDLYCEIHDRLYPEDD